MNIWKTAWREDFLAQIAIPLWLYSPLTALGKASSPKGAFGHIIQCQQEGTRVLSGGDAGGKRGRPCLQKNPLHIQISPRERHCEEVRWGHQLFPYPAGIALGCVE